MNLDVVDLPWLALGLTAAGGIGLAVRDRVLAIRERRRLAADGINGSAMAAARAGVRLEEFRIATRIFPLIAAVWLSTHEAGQTTRIITVSLWCGSLVVDALKSVYWHGLRELIVALERARVRRERERKP